jgi:hypothetical protein
MRIVFRVVPGAVTPWEWPEGWPVPNPGDTVEWDNDIRAVSSVTYYPVGEPRTGSDPVILVILH